jgi:hypothetical protein
MNRKTTSTRRQVLKGAGVSLALPVRNFSAAGSAPASATARQHNDPLRQRHGGNQQGIDIPLALIGGHGGVAPELIA